MFDFNKYDDVALIKDYDGFIDKYGNFYKVCPRMKKLRKEIRKDSHNEWAQQFITEKLNIKDFKFNPTTSALFTLSTLRGPAEILVHCFGYVYYSHDSVFHKPIIKLPNPKIANYKITDDQLNTLYLIMTMNKEDTNIPIFFGEEEFDYCAKEEPKVYKK